MNQIPPLNPPQTPQDQPQVPLSPTLPRQIMSLSNIQPAVYAFMITLILGVGAIVLVAMGKTVPSELWQIAGGSGLVGAGALNPKVP